MEKKQGNQHPGQKFFSDPTLQEMLFDRMPMGIAIIDSSYDILRFNPTWMEFSQRYAPPSGAPLTPGVNYFDHLPGTEAVVQPLFDKVLSGETVRQDHLKLEAGGITTYWDVVLAPLSAEDQVEGILNVAVDVTARVEGQINLENRVTERTRELDRRREIAESLRDIISMINTDIPLDMLLDQAVRLASERLGAAACVLHRFDLDKKTIHNLAAYSLDGILTSGASAGFGNLKPWGAQGYLAATLQRQPTYTNYPPYPERVEEVREDPSIPEELRPFRIAIRERFAGSFSVPLVIDGEVFGGLVFYYTEPQSFTEDQIQLGMTFAEQVALAIENAQLHEADEARQRELKILLDVAETANSSLDLEQLLASSLDLLVSQLDISRCGVSIVDENTGYLLPYLLRPDHPTSQEDMAAMMEAAQEIFQSGQMRYISTDPEVGFYEPAALIPLQTRGQKLGMLGVIGKVGQEFTPDQLALFRSIANQLGIAIENARLFEQAEENAITTERNRLARDLHDAVTQTLFSASLIADVLPKIWSRDPLEGQKRLEELRQLTRGALSEMRTLLVELRPAALADADLKDLLNHLVNAFTARTRLDVEYQADFVDNPPPEIKEMFYRITQEAFNNITKHADADRVVLKLESRSDFVQLSIADNGVGFDSGDLQTEGLGLGIMKERARSLSATLDICSKIGEGTELTIQWKSDRQEKNDHV